MGVCRGLVLSAVGIVKRTRTLVPSLCLNFVCFRLHIIIAHCASLVGRQPPISYIYRGGVTTLRTREWSLISSPSRHGVHRMHGLDGATGYRIERCRLCACTAQPLLRPKQLPGPALACWTLTPFFPAVERSRCMTSHCGARCMLVLSLSARPFTHPVAASCIAGTNHPRSRA
jgi:hypothetical protein